MRLALFGGGSRPSMRNLVLLALAACVLPTASYAAGRSTPTFPALYVLASVAPAPGASTDLEFDAEALDAGGETARMTISIPSAYGVSLAHARRSTIGAAEVVTVPLGGGSASTFKGDVTVVDPNAYAASPAGQTCDPASHVAVWAVSVGNRKLAEKMTIPIAVDRTSAGYVLTACFDEEHVANRELSTFDFQIRNSFAFPRVRGRYLFDATVTPFTSDGAANEAASYELRAYHDVPQPLSARATYTRRNRAFVVFGKLAGGAARSGVTLNVWAGPSSDTARMKKIGSTTTGAGGSYAFTKRVGTTPRYVFVEALAQSYPSCPGQSKAPAGCASYSIDGTGSFVEEVAVR